MNILLILLIIVSLVHPTATVQRDIHLVFVQPQGETFTPEEQALATQQVRDGIAFWMDRAPLSTQVRVRSSQLLTTDADVFRTVEWSQPFWNTSATAGITLFVIDNSESSDAFWDTLPAFCYPQYSVAMILLSQRVQDAVAISVAHELGHLLYNLPDLYYDGPCTGIDIMCEPVMAYRMRFIGCTSLATMGSPCQRVVLPMLTRG